MTGREKQEREEFYKTVMLSLGEMAQSWDKTLDLTSLFALQEILPDYADAGSKEEKLVRGILLDETDEPVDEETADQMFLGAADAEETKKLYEAVKNAQTDEEWDSRIWELGCHCLEWLSVIWTENLLEL